MKIVSFVEAMIASKAGELVRLHSEGDGYLNLFGYDDQLILNGFEGFSMQQLLEGDWEIIKNNTNKIDNEE